MQEPSNRFEDIETKLAFQEHLLESLNEALTGQQVQIDTLRKIVKQLNQQIDMGSEQIKRPEEETPPPHY